MTNRVVDICREWRGVFQAQLNRLEQGEPVSREAEIAELSDLVRRLDETITSEEAAGRAKGS